MRALSRTTGPLPYVSGSQKDVLWELAGGYIGVERDQLRQPVPVGDPVAVRDLIEDRPDQSHP